MLHEYHAQMMIRDRERHLRRVTEHARLHRDAVGAKPARSRWARIRRRPAEAQPSSQPAPRPAYTR